MEKGARYKANKKEIHECTDRARRKNWCLHSKSSVLLVTSCLLLLPQVTMGSVYPPFFNAALNKPVTLTPADDVCGQGTSAQFCKSMTDRQSVLSCWEQECGTRCPGGREQLPVWEDAFNRVVSWPSCLTRNATFRPPPQGQKPPATYSGYFPGDIPGQTCYLELDRTWMTQIRLMGSWDLSISAWIYNMLDSTQTGTIFDISDMDGNPLIRLVLQGDQLKIQGGSPLVTREEPTWTVPRREWYHVLVRVHDKSVDVYFNGNHVAPSVYNIPLQGTGTASLYKVGYSEIGHFVGFMYDFQIYMSAVSNREVKEIMAGVLPEIRIQSFCRCPFSHPRLKDDDMNYCVQNAGAGQEGTEIYRLNKEAYLLEFVNDGKPDTAWISRPADTPSSSNEEKLEFDLLDVFEVRHVEIVFYSPFPNVVIIERKRNDSAAWTAWKYYSQDCITETGYPEGEPLGESASAINCQYIVVPGDEIPYSMGKITFDLLAGRKGHENQAPDTFSNELREFLQASHIRVTVRGYPYARRDKHKYHSIFELRVNGTCNCHGHASTCAIGEYPYECECARATYTEGRLCDRCEKGAFLDPNKNPYSTDLCQLCDCSPRGTVNGSTACDEVGGQCHCKDNAGGRQCDTCLPGYYNLAAANKDGCEMCTCYTNGTVNGSNICDVSTGQCPCKDNVHGPNCDQCKAGHYNMDDKNPEGCDKCGCNIDGTKGGSETNCNATGHCDCKINVVGRACGACADGNYALESKNGDGCKDCMCDANGAVNKSCDATSGQCICKLNVIGRQCNTCAEGYYALDAADMNTNGCSHKCACTPEGTKDGTVGECVGMGGQCTCRLNTKGRSCDTCKGDSYTFGAGVDGCLKCECIEAGSQNYQCDNITGQCNCKENVHHRQCDACKPAFYGLDIGIDQGCMPCECNDLGSEGNVCGNVTGQCPCYQGDMDLNRGGRQCMPYLDDIDPVYGPESGGTPVTFSGGYLGNDTRSRVTIGDFDCMVDLYKSSLSGLVCITPSLESVGQQEPDFPLSLPVVLHLADGSTFNVSKNFTYLMDPEISDVEPLRTFLDGGIDLTVTGKDLNSVAYPTLEVTMVYNEDELTSDSVTFESPCKHRGNDGTVMICPTPNITLPDGVIPRIKRDLSHSRAKRQTTIEKKLNSDRLNFYLGFRLDGVMLYKNMTNINPEYSVLEVYVNPKLSKFEEEDHLRMFRPYWPFNDEYLIIKGADLDYGAGPEDYTVMVGDAECKIEELAINQITCEPPASKPSVSDFNHKNGVPHVEVTVGNILFLAGYLDYEHSFWDNTAFRWGVIGGCIGAFLLILLIIIVCCCCCRKKTEPDDGFDHPQKKYPKLESKENGRAGNAYIHGYNGSNTGSYLNPEMAMDILDILPRDLRMRVEDCVIDYKRMVVGKIIGEGHFGRVHIGRLHNENLTQTSPVAIKTMKENTGHTDIVQFLEEATIMKDFRHENVLSLIGVVFENGRSYVILPIMENGDLKSYISNEENLLTVGELIDCGLQVAKGMNYLSEQRFVHRDLACRNCMIDTNLRVRVADFGLSRDIYSSEYYRVSDTKRPLPVKWLALESLQAGVFTTKSDVWSFGVLLWELLTRGCTPYPDVESYDLRSYLTVGSRMDRPDYSPDEMYVLMISCWDETPGRRPTFYDIILRISDFLEISNSKTVMRDHQSQQIPTVAYRGRSYLSLVGH